MDKKQSVDARWFPWLMGTFLTLFFSFIFFEPSLSWGYFPYNQEDVRYASLLRHFQAAQAEGVMYPRWLPDLYGGYGYPTFVFYQPVFFFVAAGMAAVLGVGAPLACQLTCGLFFAFGTFGAYCLGYHLGHRKIIGGFWCSMMFAMAPYMVIDYSIRGSLSEFVAMVLTPWPLYAGLLLFDRMIRGLSLWFPSVVFVISLATLIGAHPATALFYVPTLLALMIVFVFMSGGLKDKQTLVKHVSFQVGLALSISSFYWWPVFQMKKWVNLTAVTEGFYVSGEHLIRFDQLFGYTWGWTEGNAAMSFQLGLLHFLVAVSGLCIVWRRTWFRWVGVIYLMILLLIYRNPISEFIWAQDTLLNNVQFPWRALSLAVMLQAILSVGWGHLKVHRWARWGMALVMLGWLLWSQHEMRAVSPKSQQRLEDTYTAVTQRVERDYQQSLEHDFRFANMDEFLPISAVSGMKPRGEGPLVKTRDGVIIENDEHSRHHIRVTVRHDKKGIVRIYQLYLDGWKILLDGRPLSRKEMHEGVSQEGFIQVVVPQGEHQLEAYYEGPPGSIYRIILCALLGGWYCLVIYRRRKTRLDTV